MRVITGKAKGRKLKTLPGNDVRPTTDGVKEAIFSIVQFDLENAVVLDLFAGSGQLGIEAISRGAKKAIFVDNSSESIKVIRENIKAVGFESESVVLSIPNNAFLKSNNEKIDIAILDPPYNHSLIQKSLPQLVDKMSANGIIICEHERETVLPEVCGKFEVSKIYNHGRTSLTVYRRNGGDREE